MANAEHVRIARLGSDAWNDWRQSNRDVWSPDLSGEDLTEINLSEANLRGVNFKEANLTDADLSKSELNRADLSSATLTRAFLTASILRFSNLADAQMQSVIADKADFLSADLSRANLTNASLISSHLIGVLMENAVMERATLSSSNMIDAQLINARMMLAVLYQTNLNNANLTRADLREANLSRATLISTNLTEANLNNARVYGTAVWDPILTNLSQENLVITRENEPEITVDSLELAQFIYLLIENEKVRQAIDTITTKVVLILGRFTDERKIILDAIRNELRKRNYLPILFDFKRPANRDFTATVSILANMARFVVADLSQPKSIPHELATIVPHLRSVPIRPIIVSGESEYGMFNDFQAYPWVLPIYTYLNIDDVLAHLSDQVIEPAEHKANELRPPT